MYPRDPMARDEIADMRMLLLERRTVMVEGTLDDDAAGRIAAELMTLDATGDDHIKLLLNCAGGSLGAALTVMDVIDLLGVPVHATCIGRAEGPPVGVIAVAARRDAVRHAQFRLCEPSQEFRGRADDVVRWAEQRREQLDRFCRRLATAMCRPPSWVANAIEEGRYLDAGEAVRDGIVDELARPHAAAVHRLDAGRLGFRPGRS